MDVGGWIYIMASGNSNVLYAGVTNDLWRRVMEHRTKRNPGCFSARYNVFKLVYYEGRKSIIDAIRREKYIKGKTRAWKEELINSMNPLWFDLSDTI